MSTDRPPLVLYHADCADGAGAAFAAWCKLGDRAEYRAVRHGDPAPGDDEVRGRDVYVLDFSYPFVDLNRMADASASVHVADHHKTFFEEMAKHPVSEWSPRLGVGGLPHRSGAVLAWDFFHQTDELKRGLVDLDVPEVLRYVEDRDLWRWALPGSREISAALEARGLREDFHVLTELLFHVRPGSPTYADTSEPISAADVDRRWDPLHPPKNAPHGWNLKAALIEEGATLLRARDQQVRYVASLAERVALRWGDPASTIECLAACSPVLQSEVGATLAARSRDLGLAPVGVVWYRDGRSGVYRVSLRSVDGYDVSEIARARGGGGHRAAAGFECRLLPWPAPFGEALCLQ